MLHLILLVNILNRLLTIKNNNYERKFEFGRNPQRVPKGTKLYSPIVGEVKIKYINDSFTYPICVEWDYGYISLTKAGLMYEESVNGECMLFPSKDQRDWSKFRAPWLNKHKFDPKTLKAFDRVLTRDSSNAKWSCNLFSHIDKESESRCPYVCEGFEWRY